VQHMPPVEELKLLQSKYREASRDLQSTECRAVYKQYFALQNRINTSLLVSQGRPTPTNQPEGRFKFGVTPKNRDVNFDDLMKVKDSLMQMESSLSSLSEEPYQQQREGKDVDL
jgi:hypothetical protein